MNNIDPSEIAKFESLATKWWDPNTEFAPLHKINPLRLAFIEERSKIENVKILDVGCGGGILSEAMARKGGDVVGIDAGAAPIAVAKLHAKQSDISIDYNRITVEELLEKKASDFELICCLEMLEHVPEPNRTVKACADLLKPGGDVYFSTINRNPKAFMFAIIGAEYILSLLPKGTHEYKKFIRPSELDSWARESGLILQRITGLHYNPFSKVYKLGSGVDVNYIAHYKKPLLK